MDDWVAIAAGFFGATTGALLGPLANDYVQNLGRIRVEASIISSPELVVYGDSGVGSAWIDSPNEEDFRAGRVVLRCYASARVENAKRRTVTVSQPRLVMRDKKRLARRISFGRAVVDNTTDWSVPAGSARQLHFSFLFQRDDAKRMVEHPRLGLQLGAVGVLGVRNADFGTIYVQKVQEDLKVQLEQLERASAPADQ